MNLDKYIYQHIRKKNHSILIWFLFHTHIPSHHFPNLSSTFSPSSLYPSNLYFFLSHLIIIIIIIKILLLLFPLPFQSIVTAHAPTIQLLTLLPSFLTTPLLSTSLSCVVAHDISTMALPFKALHCIRRLSHPRPFTHGKTTMVLVISPGNQYDCHLHPSCPLFCVVRGETTYKET